MRILTARLLARVPWSPEGALGEGILTRVPRIMSKVHKQGENPCPSLGHLGH